MSETCILAIDQGTSSSRAILFSLDGKIKAIHQQPVNLIYPQNGWVEQDAKSIISTTKKSIHNIVDKAVKKNVEIGAVAITNQRETTICWNRKTGDPVYNAIVWQDRRTADYCKELQKTGCERSIQARTGLLLDPYFSATKIKWILDNVDGARALAEQGDLLFGTVDSYILWHLTGGKVHATDVTNASRTMLYNIIGQKWDDYLLDLFDINDSVLPEVFDNISDFGRIKCEGLSLNLPIRGIAGDQQAALIGQGCLGKGMTKSTYGTGCFALTNIGDAFKASQNRLLTTIAYRIDGKITYAIEGAIFNAGTAIQFLRDNLGLFSHVNETEDMAKSVKGNGEVYFVPALTGLGAPYWNPAARGIICGLGRDSTKAHIVRAALEAQAYQTRDLLEAMQEDSRSEIAVMRADGGLVVNEFMCQFLADILGVAIEIPKVTECTAWGAACLAGVGAGMFSSIEEIGKNWKADRIYTPSMSRDEAMALYHGWKRAIEKSF
ncbi:MAG: glycerol kinase GlpK [Alphaproteobacteria bacterium]|nr:glycerol kinase GlpK [Alphaproteobacteria bacterium]